MEAIRASGDMPASLKDRQRRTGQCKRTARTRRKHIIAPTERFDSESLVALPELQNSCRQAGDDLSRRRRA
jgi:hypothetical protein